MATGTFDKEIVVRSEKDKSRLKAILESPLPQERIRVLPAYTQQEKQASERLFYQCLSHLKA